MDESLDMGMDVPQTPLTEWKNEPSVTDLKRDLQEAQSTHDSQVMQIEDWLDVLHVRGKAAPPKNRQGSQVAPKLVRKQAEWRYPNLSEPFLSTEDVFTVEPISASDVKAARQNKLILNNQFNTKIDKVAFIDEFVRTAVEEGTAIVRVGWEYEEEETEIQVPEFEFYADPQLGPMHATMAQERQMDPASFEQRAEPLRQAHSLSMERGVPHGVRQVGMKAVKTTRVTKNQPTLEVCDFRNVIIDPTCRGDVDKASFVIHSFETSLSELKKDGRYSNLDKIKTTENTPLSEPDHATTDTSNFTFKDKPRQKFVAYEYWGYWDIDGSGTVKAIVGTWVGDTLIRMEENPFPDGKIPFVVIPYLPVRKSTYGEPDGALIEDNQKITGAVTRGMIDLLGKSANSQTGVRKDALDVTNRRKFAQGQDYEFNANVDPRQAFYQHTFPEIPQSAQVMLQMQSMEAESLTGVKAFNNGISGQSLGDVAAGVRGALDASSKRETSILRRLSKGMVKIGRKIIAMNGEFLSEEEVVRVSEEEFIPVRRDDLPGNFDLRLGISTAEEDNQKAQELSFMLQTMGNSMESDFSRMILAEIARLRKMPALAKKIESYQPQPDQQAQLELEKLKAEVAKLQADVRETETDAQLNQARVGTEQARAEHLSSQTDKANLDFVEQESGVKQERELQKHGEQARSQANLKMLEHSLGKNGQNPGQTRH
ncbi:portal protein [Larsenimonas suaedae]|uniref:Chromosome partitioning protein ParB n=1 Tax=Larsenimonas suaedae TaxID=1851019 RepID=A0ABU1GYX6_9GAMM|nr:hypothetical protein [Larsenimonas suaedae]MCM2973732.1 hypothetical protein [Larsenimonas suaedae]MDR5897255.1 hypothetical protein [Larsenimonas suaedae]